MFDRHREPRVHIEAETDPQQKLYELVEKVLTRELDNDALYPRIVRLCIPVDRIDPFDWLQNQDSREKFIWAGRETKELVAGTGKADVMSSGENALKQALFEKRNLMTTHAVRYYGGGRFDLNRESSPIWSEFGPYQFMLPRFELHRSEKSTRFFCNIVLPKDLNRKSQLLDEVSRVNFEGECLSGDLPLPISRIDKPNKHEWYAIVRKVLADVDNEEQLKKVVMAREATFNFTDALNEIVLFKRLCKLTPGYFQFYFQPAPAKVFMGASPERLFRRKGRYVESEAIAGTGRRGDDEINDRALAQALLSSEKDQREHAFVRQSVMDAFASLCKVMHIDREPAVLDLSIGRHLQSKFWGVLNESTSDVDIINKLHPTSAVGGVPKEEAMAAIRSRESFDRGWYAGPIGWFGKDAAEFAVAIRSAVASENVISLYSGAGIVKGSTPENEWNEIEQKLGDFIKALGLDQRIAKY